MKFPMVPLLVLLLVFAGFATWSQAGPPAATAAEVAAAKAELLSAKQDMDDTHLACVAHHTAVLAEIARLKLLISDYESFKPGWDGSAWRLQLDALKAQVDTDWAGLQVTVYTPSAANDNKFDISVLSLIITGGFGYAYPSLNMGSSATAYYNTAYPQATADPALRANLIANCKEGKTRCDDCAEIIRASLFLYRNMYIDFVPGDPLPSYRSDTNLILDAFTASYNAYGN